MEKEQLKFYESPEVQVIQIENDNILCSSDPYELTDGEW